LESYRASTCVAAARELTSRITARWSFSGNLLKLLPELPGLWIVF
jgi:hypothetical protein